MDISLSLTANQQAELRAHLFPGDGNEAVALALCGRRAGTGTHRLLLHKIVPVPYEYCSLRAPDQVTWSTDILMPLLSEAAKRRLGILKIHGHSESFPHHSDVDDEADRHLFPSIYGWMEDDYPHASAIMLPSGRIFGRTVSPKGEFEPLSAVKVVGDNLHFWHAQDSKSDVPEFARRTAQTFGRDTFAKLRKLKVAVVGCSGTGSPVVEQLARLGVGTLVLVDPDHIEEKNLNRVLNATLEDARRQTLKVDVARRSINNMGLGTEVVTFPQSLFNPEVVKAIAECDVVFGCMDSVDGRHLLNRLATFYLLPYFDVGVKLEADGKGGIDQACGTVHYLQPGRSSLLSRSMFTLEQVRAAGMKRTDPAHYEEQIKEKYIVGVQEDRPAVISVNMLFASLAMNELLARLHPYRDDPNSGYAAYTISLSQGRICQDTEGETYLPWVKYVGRGDMTPLLEMPELSEMEMAV